MSIDLEHLQDHITLLRAAFEARVTSSEAAAESLREIAVECQERIAVRALRGELTSTLVFDRLGLTESERQVVWMLAAVATNREARALLPHATGEATPDPTLAAIRLVVYGATPSLRALHELAPDGRLRQAGILERSDVTTDHESKQTWTLAPRVLEWLHGGREISCWLTSLRSQPSHLAAGDLAVSGRALEEARELVREHEGVVIVAGPVGTGRRSLLESVARENGIALLSIDARRLATEPAAALRQLRAIGLECQGSAVVPLIANLDVLDEPRLEAVHAELVQRLDRVLGTCGVNRLPIRWNRPAVFLELAKPSVEQTAMLWCQALDGGTPAQGHILATRYPLVPALIHHAARVAIARTKGGELTGDDVAAGVRSVLDDRLGQFARRVTVTQAWNDIVLPSDSLEAVAELIARVRGRGRVVEEWGFGAKVGKGLGVTALFSGPPGTGKTMLASLIAQDLGLELYQVDLGKVVSKWIGETEKNLGALFDAAEAGHAILLFDEADALFGKRTDVKSSNDRHANLETNYLLQRLESYTGICLLTTNHDSHIDPAFQRRLSLHLRIELPDISERAELWRTMLPPAAPVANDIDFARLAQRYAMSGGYIRNAVLRAAFVAADHDRAITHDGLERAARREYEGMGKIVAG